MQALIDEGDSVLLETPIYSYVGMMYALGKEGMLI